MIPYPDIDPIALDLGKVKIRWYGIMYLIGFAIAWFLARRRARDPAFGWKEEWVDDLIFYSALGVILGGRFGYILFYGFDDWIKDPTMLFRIWEGGMSFHGGMLGVITAMWLYGRKLGKPFFEMTDFVATLPALGLGFGRIGNFINGELWGKPTDLPWGFQVGEQVLHPSQLYESFLEGFVLFFIVWLYSARHPPTMAVSGVFLFFYGLFRFLVEFVRVPDPHLGYLAFGWVTMGQILSLPMMLFGLFLVVVAYRRPRVAV